jgi:hypothetical protein
MDTLPFGPFRADAGSGTSQHVHYQQNVRTLAECMIIDPVLELSGNLRTIKG